MQRPATAKLLTLGLIKRDTRTAADSEIDPGKRPTPGQGDCAEARRADERLMRELGLWQTFMHGGEKPTLRR